MNPPHEVYFLEDIAKALEALKANRELSFNVVAINDVLKCPTEAACSVVHLHKCPGLEKCELCPKQKCKQSLTIYRKNGMKLGVLTFYFLNYTKVASGYTGKGVIPKNDSQLEPLKPLLGKHIAI